MKKYLDKKGREVNLGDAVVIKMKQGAFITRVTQELLDEGIESRALHFADDSLPEGTHVDIDFYVSHLAERIGWNVKNLLRYLDNLYKIYPTAIFHILLREIAIVLDEKYPDHIERSEEIWVISTASGEIGRIPANKRHTIKNYRNFAAFRTLDDAKAAKHILSEAIKDLFSRPNKKGGK